MKKKIILSSVLSIVLCLSLIVGATFALFTSEARVNIAVTSGNVKLTATLKDLATSSLGKDMADGAFELGGQAAIDGDTLKIYKMTPGDMATFTVDVENKSDVAIQYCVKLVGTGELVGALEAVATINGVGYAISGTENATDWISVAGGAAIDDIKVSVLMPHTVGNEYQGKAADIAIQLIAIQGNAGSGIYVKGVQYADLDSAIAAAVAASAPVQISGTVEIFTTSTSSAVVDLQGVTIEGLDYATLVFKNPNGYNAGGTNAFANVNLKNLTVVDETFYTSERGENAWEFTYLELEGTNTFENVVFTDGVMLDGDNTFVECTFMGHNNDSSEYGNVAMYGAWVNSGVASFTKCDFVGTRGLKAHEAYGSDVTKVTVEACSFGPLSEKPGIALGDIDATTEISVANSTFTAVQAGDQGLYIYESDTDVTTFVFTLTNNKVSPADGVSVEGNVYSISNANGMFWFAQQVNEEGNSFAGKTVQLVANVDLKNADWDPIGQTGATEFKGVFDGQGYTIKNLSVDSTDEFGGHYSSGLFGWIESHGEGVTVKNLTIDGAKIAGHHNCAVVVGYIYGTVENVTVKNATVSCVNANDDANGDKAGIIAGYVGDATVKGCKAIDCAVSAGRDAGQIVGAARTAQIVDCSATNVSVVANGTGTGKNIKEAVIGRVLG
ncbi:MAG: hypothetical protein J6L83_02360 [Clostridia bacterium]|nr:hypothetical protein [Clostridia bacterium]